MNTQEFLKHTEAIRERATKNPGKCIKLYAGCYYIQHKNTLYVVEKIFCHDGQKWTYHREASKPDDTFDTMDQALTSLLY